MGKLWESLNFYQKPLAKFTLFLMFVQFFNLITG